MLLFWFYYYTPFCLAFSSCLFTFGCVTWQDLVIDPLPFCQAWVPCIVNCVCLSSFKMRVEIPDRIIDESMWEAVSVIFGSIQ